MATRPDALGLEFSVENLDDADRVLQELSYLVNQQSILDAQTKQKIDDLKRAAQERAVCEIEGEVLPIADRIAALSAVLGPWVESHIADHLPARKKSIDLPHGCLGLRQQPVVAEFGEGETPQSVLDRIDESTGLVTAVNAILERKVPTLGRSVVGRDLLKIEVVPATKSMQAAVEAKRLTAAQLAEFGLFLRDAYNEPVIKPAKIVVS